LQFFLVEQHLGWATSQASAQKMMRRLLIANTMPYRRTAKSRRRPLHSSRHPRFSAGDC
jgi:hypothetical protein